jgi:hypothetical protein
MIAYACGSGAVLFVPEEIERKEAQENVPVLRRSNDNKGDALR